MFIDYHIHSRFSPDSETDLNEICRTAIQNGLDEICFTDHMDFTYPHAYENLYIHDLDNYLKTIDNCRKQFDGQLKIRSGVEIGLEIHRLKDYDNMLNLYPFDFVIGSVHEINGIPVSRADFFQGKKKTQVYQEYYSNLLECIREFDNFDVIGHLDYCKRYMPYPYECGDHLHHMELINTILSELVSRGKGIEVNTSGYRHESAMCLPHFDILRHFHQLGGTRITTGSDSHKSEHVGYKVPETTAVLKELGFQTISTFGLRHEYIMPL